ncbi:MAG TPA: hypothetical protein VG537_07060 [Candidatus Kapabacteria bacterium]|jgi:hypothetical protein|nr:hypothetical protein [Candidatus Kapabacteria bacterium]
MKPSGLLKEWKFWALVIVLAVFVFDISGHLFNFPIRLVLLRVGLFFAEGSWTRFRM